MNAEAPTPLDLVQRYLDAVAAFDYDIARGYLSDDGFEYVSPISTFRCADALTRYLQLATPIIQRIAVQRAFADGADVAHFLMVTTQLSEKLYVNVAQWAHVRAGRIDRLQLVFDAHWYRSMFMPDEDPGRRPASAL